MKEYFSRKSSGPKGPFARLLGSGIFLALGLVISVFVFSGFLKITWQKMEIQREIDKLKTEAGKLEADNKYLSDILDFVGSESFKEREMRLKLNLQKEGEKVIIISDEGDRIKAEQILARENADTVEKPNYRKWWNYFFGNQ